VTLAEINEGALQKAKTSIETNLKRVAKKVHKVRCSSSYPRNKTNV
jgi:adenine-specific DNA glycosylase